MDRDRRDQPQESDRSIRPPQPGPRKSDGRAFRPIGNASSAFNVRPWVSANGARGSRVAGRDWLSHAQTIQVQVKGRAGSRKRTGSRPMLVPDKTGGLRLNPRPCRPQGPPWLYGYLLYDGSSEAVHEFFVRNLFELDEATSANVLLTYIGNPKEVGPAYEILRDPALRKLDDSDAESLTEELGSGVGADYVRRREVMKLTRVIGVEREQLPCIVFFANPPCAPPAILPIRPEWLATAEVQRTLRDAIIDLFTSDPELKRLPRISKSNLELTKGFSRLISERVSDLDLAVGRQASLLAASAEECRFQRQGAIWHLAFGGKETTTVHSKGMTYIGLLLDKPTRVFPASELRSLAAKEDQLAEGSAGERLTREAIAAGRGRIASIDEELAEAESNDDLAKISVLKRERASIAQELAHAMGYRGRVREDCSDREKARKSVSAAIRRALRTIRRDHPLLHQHLDRHLHRGSTLAYLPEKPTSWAV